MQLDPKQQEAVLHAEGPAIVVAGPGSGKTAVLTHRVDHLIKQLHIPPEKIMVITFARAAAEEMKSRFQAFPGEADAPVYFATFHAAFYKILRREEGLSAGSVLGGEERLSWLKDLLTRENAEAEKQEDILPELAAELSAFKASGKDPAKYQASSCGAELFRRIFAAYEERLSISGRVDFEDMLVRTLALLRKKPAVLDVWREKYSYILVDEFQDINDLQYEILKMLAAPDNNLFVVGDDDQSIYRFRGASPDVMARFPKDYPAAARYELFACRRCSPQILSACAALIAHNRKRFPKRLFSAARRGKPPEILMFPDRRTEHAALCRRLLELHGEGVPYAHMAVLCRTNFGLAGMRNVLRREKIPCRSREKVQDIYERPEAKDLMAYLELASGNRSRRLFLRIANRPLRFLPRSAFSEDPVDPAKLLEGLRGRPGQRNTAEELLYRLAVAAKMKPYAAVSYVRNETGYDAWLKTQYGDSSAAALETLDLLQEESASFDSYAEWKAFLKDSGNIAAKEASSVNRGLAAEEKDLPQEEDAVELLTMHGAKGLEYDAVFIPDVIEGTIPHRKSLSGDALEEERRLLYVAMTRARNYLWIGWIRRDRAGKCMPSRFLKEICEKAP